MSDNKTLKEVLDECLKEIESDTFIDIKLEGEEVGYSSGVSLIAKDHKIINGTVPENYLSRIVTYYRYNGFFAKNHLIIIIENDDDTEIPVTRRKDYYTHIISRLNGLKQSFAVSPNFDIDDSHKMYTDLCAVADKWIDIYEKRLEEL